MATTKQTSKSTSKKSSSQSTSSRSESRSSANKSSTANQSSTANKSGTAKKSGAAKTSGADGGDEDAAEAATGHESSAASTSAKPGRAITMATAAARQLAELVTSPIEGVTGVEKTEDGWKVDVEVLDVRRIPDTTDVLALYDVELDSEGELTSYRRTRRYSRGSVQED